MNTSWGRRLAVTVRRYPGQDRFGDKLPAIEHQVPQCVWAPGGSTEDFRRGETVTDTVALYGPRDADLRADDEIRLPGEPGWWQVDGTPRRWSNPFLLGATGLEATLRRITG